LDLPLVAIVILNYNGRNYLEKFLPSVIASTYPNKKIIIADNASTDDSVLYIRNDFKEAEIILLDKNYGFAGGYNKALSKVMADYYILLNSDVEATPGWITPVISLMESDTTIAACQPKILAFENKSQFEYAGASGGWIDKFGYPFNRGRIFDFCENDEGQYNNTSEIFWATGAAMFVRPSVYHEQNGFDEYFFAHQEEIDLCWRMQRAGYKIFVVPDSVVYHLGGGTLPAGNKRKVFLNFRNNLVMLSKNLPFREKIWKIPFRISLDNIAAFQALIKGDFITFKAIQRAHFYFLNWIFLRQKQIDLPKKYFANLHGTYNGSIVWQYFIKKRKTFSEILQLKK